MVDLEFAKYLTYNRFGTNYNLNFKQMFIVRFGFANMKQISRKTVKTHKKIDEIHFILTFKNNKCVFSYKKVM